MEKFSTICSYLRKLLENSPSPICYDGFEPSGRMHIAQGVQKAINVNKLTRAGCTFVFWVADWFAQLNNKMDGDLDKIRTVCLRHAPPSLQVGRYFIEVWKACGMEMDRVKFLWASDEINARCLCPRPALTAGPTSTG
jgi:tyrosyl-tRNA synthetase